MHCTCGECPGRLPLLQGDDPATEKGEYQEGEDKPDVAEVKEPEPLPKPPEPVAALEPEVKKPEVKPKPEIKPKPEVKPKPKPKEKPKIEVSKTKVVRRSPSNVKPEKRVRLTEAEIRRLLNQGARTAARASLSEQDLRRVIQSGIKLSDQGAPLTEEMLYLELIRATMYSAWNQPSSAAANGLVTKVEINLNPDGSITGNQMVRGSGSPAMDDSVLKAVNSVRRISGVPASFLERHRNITIAFQLTDADA